MFIKDGIIYGSEPQNSLRINLVKPLPDKMLLITFNTGETRLFDAELLKGPVFEPLDNPEVFMHPVIDHGVVTWQNGEVDCAPEYMYDRSYEYTTIV